MCHTLKYSSNIMKSSLTCTFQLLSVRSHEGFKWSTRRYANALSSQRLTVSFVTNFFFDKVSFSAGITSGDKSERNGERQIFVEIEIRDGGRQAGRGRERDRDKPIQKKLKIK